MPRRLPLVVALAAACASGSGGTSAAPATPTPYTPTSAQGAGEGGAAGAAGAAPAGPRGLDAVRYGPGAVRYLVARRSHLQQRMANAPPQDQDLGARVYVVMSISGPADTVGYPVIFTVDSIVPDSGTAPPVAASMARGRRLVFSGRLTPRGDFVNARASDTTTAQSLIQLLGTFRDFLPRLPAGGLKLGAAWTDTVEVTQRAGGAEITRHSISHTTAAAWAERAGVRTLRLEGMFTYRLAGAGQNAGQPFELAGAGDGTVTSFIADDGRYVGGESRDSASLTVRLPVQGVAIPVIQVTRTTVTVLP
jgi:hypothetical protein